MYVTIKDTISSQSTNGSEERVLSSTSSVCESNETEFRCTMFKIFAGFKTLQLLLRYFNHFLKVRSVDEISNTVYFSITFTPKQLIFW